MEANREYYVAPRFRESAFHCPSCSVYANQTWLYCYHSKEIFSSSDGRGAFISFDNQISQLEVAYCDHCRNLSFWVDQRLVCPSQTTAPYAHKDMPESILEYYNEAREISAASPRAAAALLRLAAKKLCEHLNEPEPNLNRAIGNLSKRGLPESIIKSLDTIRIVGNEGGAHEGQIDLTGGDNKQIVDKLFWLINFIIEKTIAEPQEVEGMLASLPEDKKQGVEVRDKRK